MRLSFEIAEPHGAMASGREATLESGIEIEAFLRGVQGRAFRIALVTLRDHEEALDSVQDAMLRLVRRYARRPAEEWPPLFYRILRNRLRDGQRRRAVRTRFLSFFGGIESEDPDPLLAAPAPAADGPFDRLAAADAMQALEQALATLPARQREAFMLRNFEGLDVAQTAIAMSCSTGSVKTHYSRAVHRLRELLKEHGGEHWQ